MNKIKLLGILATMLIFAGCGETVPKAPGKYAEVSKCLTQKGVIMYGAYWCPHCQNQKSFFGDDFQFVHYQECDDKGPGGNHKACLAAGVQSYPTWYFPGQGNLTGEQQVADLGRLANCTEKLPKEDQDKLAAAQKAAEEAAAKTAPETKAADATATTTSTPTIPPEKPLSTTK